MLTDVFWPRLHFGGIQLVGNLWEIINCAYYIIRLPGASGKDEDKAHCRSYISICLPVADAEIKEGYGRLAP